jgi:GR25 family glycosyltransferase involved in LPS biosynthesis
MKAFIHYVKNHKESEEQASQALASFLRYGWEAQLQEGITPDTLDESEFDYPIIEGGRLEGFKAEQPNKYLIKKSCLSNQIRLWRKVVEENESMAFIEHDAICIGKFDYEFDELLCLNVEYAFQPPSVLGTISSVKGYKAPLALASKPLDTSYPLLYYKNNIYKNYAMIPGTAAYVVSPKGAKKLLEAAEKNGIDQSDFFINTYNVKIEYINPSPVKFNTKNLNTSHFL